MSFLLLLFLIIIALIVFYAGQLLLCVIVIKISSSYQDNITFYTYDPNIESPPKEVLQYIQTVYEELKLYGFQIAGYFYQEGVCNGVSSYVTVFQSPQTMVSLIVYSIKASNGILSKVNHSMEFETEFADGGVLNTLNSKAPLGIFKPRPGKQLAQFSSVTNCSDLYQRHQVLLTVHANRKRNPPKTTPDEVKRDLIESTKTDLRYQVSVGILYYLPKNEKYYFTILGAIRAVLLLHIPMLQIRRAYRTWKNESLLKRLRAEHSASMQPYSE